jgi:uncharacterized membrane protein
MAVDGKHLIVIDEKVKERGLFSYILPKVIAAALLFGLTVYGFFYAILHPKAISFYKRLDSIDPRYVLAFVILGLTSMFMYWALKRIKNY